VEFDVISVVTPVTLDHTEDYLKYMTALAPRSLGIKVEESEGPHTSSALGEKSFLSRFQSFADRLTAWSASTGIPVRELRSIDQVVRDRPRFVRNTQNVPGAIITMAVDGTLSTFSPELAGQHDRQLKSLSFGNVFDADILAKIANCGSGEIAASIRRGVARCHAECAYFMFCGGGSPVNKFYENGCFASTETLKCRTTVMAFADAYATATSLGKTLPVTAAMQSRGKLTP
jgi:uncharacterized protein